MARLPSSTGLPRLERPMPRAAAPPRERGAAAGVTVCLRGRPCPRLGIGEPGTSRGAFPFSAAENLFDGAIGVGGGAEEKERAE